MKRVLLIFDFKSADDEKSTYTLISTCLKLDINLQRTYTYSNIMSLKSSPHPLDFINEALDHGKCSLRLIIGQNVTGSSHYHLHSDTHAV